MFSHLQNSISCAEDIQKALKPIKDATLVMLEDSILTVSLTTQFHPKLFMGTDELDMVKDIKEAIAQDLN